MRLALAPLALAGLTLGAPFRSGDDSSPALRIQDAQRSFALPTWPSSQRFNKLVFEEEDDDEYDYYVDENGVKATEKTSHLSRWARLTKSRFMDDVKDGKAGDWTIVMGNEAGDLDSMVSALAWAYHLSHRNDFPKVPAIALLQTHIDAIDLRPENKLALHNAGMEAGHRDLLTIDELPLKPSLLGPAVKGVALVDHNRILEWWGNATVLTVIDHHTDWGTYPDARPRVIERSASCSSLVTRQLLRQSHSHGPIPKGLADLIISVIALDSDGLRPDRTTQADIDSARAMHARSHLRKQKFNKVIQSLDKEMSTAKKDLGHASVRDLLRRDWKGDIVHTPSETTPDVHLGFASIPVSLKGMIERTEGKDTEDWFKVEHDWATENHVDIAVALTSFKVKLNLRSVLARSRASIRASLKILFAASDASRSERHRAFDSLKLLFKKEKRREIIMVVRAGHRINDEEADSLFAAVVKEVEASDELQLRDWEGGKDLGHRRQVWEHSRSDGGRKVVRPIVERAVKNWHRELQKRM